MKFGQREEDENKFCLSWIIFEGEGGGRFFSSQIIDNKVQKALKSVWEIL